MSILETTHSPANPVCDDDDNDDDYIFLYTLFLIRDEYCSSRCVCGSLRKTIIVGNEGMLGNEVSGFDIPGITRDWDIGFE